MSQHSSLLQPWPNPIERAEFAEQLKAAATLEAQADTANPAFAVAFLLELAAQYAAKEQP